MTIESIIFSQLNSRFGKLGINKIVLDFFLQEKTAKGVCYFKDESKKDEKFVIDKTDYSLISAMLINQIVKKIGHEPYLINIVVEMEEQKCYIFEKLEQYSQHEMIKL